MTIPVHLALYGGASHLIVEESERQNVSLHHLGSYADCLSEILPERARLLSRYPTLHKFISLRSLPIDDASRVLYLDCDTFFFGNVMALFRKYEACHFYAREEPSTRRSHNGYSASYLDEDRLRETALSEGLAFVDPYNTGICMLNHGLSQTLAAASGLFLSYAWRLLVSLCHDRPAEVQCDTDFLDAVCATLREPDLDSRLAYPSSNSWILDEIATVLALGGIHGLSHGVLRRNDALQNGEFWEYRVEPRPILVHYYSQFEDRFFRQVNRL